MTKKILDILPPTTFPEERPKPPLKKMISLPLFAKKKWWGVIPLVLIFLIIIALALYFTLAWAEIEIWPEAEVLTFKTKVTIDKTAKETNLLNKVIPGEIFEVEKTVSEEFSSSGKILNEKKAEGLVRIYNNYHLSQTLVATTRLQPPLEKFQPPLKEGENPWFRTLEKVTIPAKGHKDVKVIADSPGEKYNLPPSIFSLPGLAGSPQYTFIYGESFEPMKGGLKTETPRVTQKDLDKAKSALSEKAKEESRVSLKNKMPVDFDFLDGATETEILETFSLARAGTELEKFSYQVKAKSATLAFKKEDLDNFAGEFILSEIPSGKLVHRESLKINYFLETFNLGAAKIILSLNLEAKIYSDIDEISLKKGLQGKSSAETKIFLENLPQISRAQIKLWPFWVRSVPENIEKIEIKLRVDPAPISP